ncbi:hypothetical protein HIM_03056 [Hirsutella minnesotensis 3608]|nr:hypothetical protein HIM_03056 [Hirsutella minnesotensis 3608]
MSATKETKNLEAKCFCGSVHFTFEVPVSLLPLTTYLCHCSWCRYSTGAPCIFHAQMPEGLLPNFVGDSSESNMVAYTAEGLGCSHDFCSTCGCHISGVTLDRRQWTVSTSIFTDYGPDKFQIKTHVFSKSAKGGGLASILTRIRGGEMGDWNPPDDDPSAKVAIPEREKGPDGQDRLRAQCHCGGVSFTIKRPTQRVLDDPTLSKVVSPIDKSKWIASLDACSDCRLTSGTHVVGWTFVPFAMCEPSFWPNLQIGTAKSFSSSEGVLRSFCGTCGATLFYTCKDRTSNEETAVVDIATGIIRAPEGAMAEDWVTWKTPIAFTPDGESFDRDFTLALSEGMRNWAKEKYGRELDFQIDC